MYSRTTYSISAVYFTLCGWGHVGQREARALPSRTGHVPLDRVIQSCMTGVQVTDTGACQIATLVLDGSPSPTVLLSSINKLNILDKFLPSKYENKQMVDISPKLRFSH
jgi:hypothetical protein